MDRLEKVEKLRKYADASYEEAMQALEQADGDLLEAIVILEKQGKVRAENSQAWRKIGPGGSVIGNALSSVWYFLRHTAFHVTHNNKEIFVMPSWVLGLLVLCFFYTILPVMLIALLFNVRYYFTGNETADKANDVLSRASDAAESVINVVENRVTDSTSAE